MITARELRELLPGRGRAQPGVPASAGHWEARGPAVFARRTVRVPVTVGAERRIR